ncbi:penicillin-binding protein 2, partial [Breznakia sp. OttesenSCG-928-G09]|nr:penicillin-binding protein 2 [Breznakia sp. OttesenSCG-928-G09]
DYAYHVTYLRDVKDNYNSLLSADELEAANNGNLSNAEVYNLKISRMEVPKVDDHRKKIYLTKMLMDQTPENEYKTILEGATTEQVAYLGEHNSQFPGFKYMNDWVRSYYDNNNSIVKSILGDISSQTQGLPEEKMEYYMGLGYAMNQRVGISGIEKQYEDYLSGTKRSYNITYDENGLAVLNDENEGKNGYDLTLSLDVDLQKKVDEVLNKTMSTHSGGKYKYFDSLYFVAINPQTGEILAMDSIYRKEDGTIYSVPTGTYLDANRAGSVVKMATLYMGLDQGVISPGTVLNDQPMQLKGTQVFKSYTTHGLIDDINAIAVSSNVYMAQIAIKLAGGEFVENGQALYYEDGTFEKMRSYYNMFGLGVQTGIDLPNEGVGSIGGTEEHGKIIPLAIGQYDTYTTMQLAQYVSTIANGGKRVQPHLLKKVTEVNSNRETVIYEHQTNILSTLLGNNVKEYLGRAQKGMRGCVRGTGSKSAFCPSTVDDPNSGTQLAAKTGTAENEIYENGNKLDDTMSSTMVAYGPYIDDDDGSTPEIAFACFAPNVEIVTGTPDPNICAGIIGEVSNYYFSKKK